MLKIKKFVALFFVLFLIFFSSSAVLATGINLPRVIITPDKYLFFPFKRLIEKGLEFTKFTKQSKADYYRDLTLTRMAELKYVVDNKLLGEVEHSTQRLSSQVGILSDYIKVNKADLTGREQSVKDLFLSYKDILVKLRDNYPANSSFWMLVQHSINSIDLNLEKIK